MLNINEYHAHIYFNLSWSEIEAAKFLAEKIKKIFNVNVGRLNFKPVGPHTSPMFRVIFSKDDFSEFVQWLIFARGNLNVMIHPVTHDSYLDHIVYACWFGEKLEMKVSELDYSKMIS